jgi:hypothetical protein
VEKNGKRNLLSSILQGDMTSMPIFEYTGFRQGFFLNDHPYTPAISLKSEFSEKCDMITIPLDLKLTSSLEWHHSLKLADEGVKKNKKLLFNLELGLADLPAPFSDEGQFRSLLLGIEHFKETILTPFKDSVFGIIFYKGSIDFSSSLKWHGELKQNYLSFLGERMDLPPLKRLFCLQESVDFLRSCGSILPEEIPQFLLLDTTELSSVEEFFQLTAKEHFYFFHLGISHPFTFSPLCIMPHGSWEKERVFFLTSQRATLALCLPSRYPLTFRKNFQEIEQLNRPFRILCESQLAQDWDGVDELIIFSDALTKQGRRKLCGFCAAGGKVITIGNLCGLEEEYPFAEYCETHKRRL